MTVREALTQVHVRRAGHGGKGGTSGKSRGPQDITQWGTPTLKDGKITNPRGKFGFAKAAEFNRLTARLGAPLSHTGQVALAMAHRLLSKAEGRNTVPFPAPAPGARAALESPFLSKRLATTVIQNEPGLDGPADNPQLVVQASNDYRDMANPEKYGIHVYLNVDQNVEDPNAIPVNIPVQINKPELFGGAAGGQGDAIVAMDPQNSNLVHLCYMAFNFQDNNKNSIQVSDFDLSQLDPEGGNTSQILTHTVVEHTGANPDGSPADFEDKNNMAVDPATGNLLVTVTRFAGDMRSGSKIHAYLLKPETDAEGKRSYSLVNPGGEPMLVNDNGMWVQWSQPGFLPGSKPVVAYRNFTDDGSTPNDGIYVSTLNASSQFASTKAAQIESPVEDYFKKKLFACFRSLSAPQMAVNTSDGATYIVYDDAKSGKSLTYLVKSTDGGKSWTDPAPVGAPPQGPDLDHWMSTASVDPATGAVAVGYLGIDDQGNYAAYTTLSLDGGQNWTAPEQVSDRSNYMLDRFDGWFSGDYTTVKIRSAKNDDGTTTFKVHYAHPTAFGTDDPTVRVSTPQTTNMTYPTWAVKSYYALSKSGKRARRAS